MKVLVVDDDPISLRLVDMVLKNRGYDTLLAYDGAEGIEVLKQDAVDLVVSDVLMPVMDGFQFCAELRGNPSLRHLPFLMYTATFTDERDEALAMAVGADDFVRKPCDPKILIEKIEALLGLRHTPVETSVGHPMSDTREVYRLYNRRLMKKLETKLLELQDETKTRQQAQKDLSSLTAAIEQVAECIVLTDPDGVIEYVNPAFETVIGYTSEEVTGQMLDVLWSRSEQPELLENIWERLVIGDVWSGSLVSRRKDGNLYEQEVSISPVVGEEGHIMNFVVVSRDVTSDRQMERQLRNAQRKEALGMLAGGIAHDFNNILSAIFGFTELALMKLEPANSARADLKEVLSASRRAKNLVKQILAFSRQNEEEAKPIRIQPMVAEAFKLLRATIPSTIEIQTKIAADVGAIFADPTQIHQILMNLCTNAVQAMDESGGILRVELRNDVVTGSEPSLTELTPGEYLRLTVSDTGGGMNRDIREHIFDPYFSTKEIAEGTGLGLSVVQGIVNRYSGAVHVESEPDVGSSFHVLIPLIDAAEAETADVIPKGLPGGNERILFVDDEPALAKVATRILESLGYRVASFTSSRDALAAFRKRPDDFDLMITDMTMPSLTGDALSNAIIGIRPAFPVILCTGFSQSISEEKARRIGIRAFVMKPLIISELAGIIRDVLDRPDNSI